MNDSTFLETVQQYEDEDRILWQKPELIIEKLGDLSDKTVADIGAGTGYFTFRLLSSAKKVIAVDVEPRFIRFIDSISVELPDKLSTKLETRLALGASPELKSNEADVALMVNTFMFLSDKNGFLKNLYNSMNTGGQILIVDYKKKDLPIGPALDEKINPSEVVSALQSAGFQMVTSDETSLDYQYLVVGKK
jgi:SAM-dependent methyltransferase